MHRETDIAHNLAYCCNSILFSYNEFLYRKH